MRLSILLCSLMLLQLRQSSAAYEDTTLAPTTASPDPISTTPPNSLTLPTTTTTSTTPAPAPAPSHYADDDGYQVHHAAPHDPYEVIDVAQHAAHHGAGGYAGAGHVPPQPQQAGQTTRYYTDGEVDDSFWLKHLGEDFKHAIHLLVGGNDQYADLYNKTEPGGYMQEVHHEFVPDHRSYHLGQSPQYPQQQAPQYQPYPAPSPPQYQAHPAAPAPQDYYPPSPSHLSRGYDYSRSLPAAEHSYNESSQHAYGGEEQPQQQYYRGADEVPYVPQAQHKPTHYEQPQPQQPSYESMFKIDEAGISNSAAGGYKAAPIPPPPHQHYAAHQYSSSAVSSTQDTAKPSYHYRDEKPSYAQREHKYTSVVVAPAPAPPKTPYTTYTYDKQYTAKQKAGTEPVVVTLPEEHGTVVQHSSQDDRPLIVSMPPVIYHSYPRQYGNEQQHGDGETEADENDAAAGSGNYGAEGPEHEEQQEQAEQAPEPRTPHYTPTHHSYSVTSHTQTHTYSKPATQYHHAHQHHAHTHTNPSPVHHHNSLYTTTQNQKHQYHQQPLTRAQYPPAAATPDDSPLPDDAPAEPSESASAAAAEQLRNAFKKYSVASFYNPPPFDISSFGNSRLYRGGRGISADASSATSAAASAKSPVPVVASEPAAITPAAEAAEDAAEAAPATLNNVYVENPAEESPAIVASSSNLYSTHYLPFQTPYDSYAARVTREARDLFYKGL